MATGVRDSLLSACQTFMEPIARFLMRHGLGFKEFSEVAKAAFVKVATEEYGKRGRPTNVSRTAVLTGLTRKEVKRIRLELEDLERSPSPRLGKPAKLLEIWHHDDDFLDSFGRPRVLQMDGELGFRDLARRVGGDVPPGALLTELINANAVDKVSDGSFRCVSRHFNPSGIDAYFAERYGQVLRDLASTLDFNSSVLGKNEKRFERRVWNDSLDERYQQRFHQLVHEHGSNLLEFLDDWLSTHSVSGDESGNEKSRRRSGMGIYFFTDDTKAR